MAARGSTRRSNFLQTLVSSAESLSIEVWLSSEWTESSQESCEGGNAWVSSHTGYILCECRGGAKNRWVCYISLEMMEPGSSSTLLGVVCSHVNDIDMVTCSSTVKSHSH